MRFLSFGDSKPYIPLGVGNLMVASGSYVTHQHQTVCPQCKTSFSRPKSASQPNLSLLLNPYITQNRNSFGLIPEEMGVLTLPSLTTEEKTISSISDVSRSISLLNSLILFSLALISVLVSSNNNI